MAHETLGNLVEVHGHKMNVFSTGQGKDTFVFLAGHGTSCPTLDFKPLWSILSSKNKIAVVERAGYGWSESTTSSRDLDTILEETREALKLSHIAPPYILVPHSISGLEAIFWAQKYPHEVKAIIGLDSAIPEVYDILKIPSDRVINIIGSLVKMGVHKPFAKSICKKTPAVRSGYLTESDIATFIEVFKKSTLTPSMIHEVKYIKQNANTVRNGIVPINTPIYLFISNANEKVIPNWGKLLTDYIANFTTGRYMQLDCGHYVHACEPEKIAQEINTFITSLV